MRIIHLTHQYLPETRGGVESYVHTLAQHQASVGHHLRIVSGSFEPRDAVTTVAAEVDGIAVRRVHRADPYFDRWDRMDCPETREAVVAEVESFRPDVVHLHHWIRLAPDLVERLGEAGFPVVGAEVTLRHDGTVVARTESDAFGDFKIDGLPEDGTCYELQIAVDGRVLYCVDVEMSATVYLGDIELGAAEAA